MPPTSGKVYSELPRRLLQGPEKIGYRFSQDADIVARRPALQPFAGGTNETKTRCISICTEVATGAAHFARPVDESSAPLPHDCVGVLPI
jgi:hypothetical protein